MTTIDQQIAAWFNSNFRTIDQTYELSNTEWHYGNLLLVIVSVLLSIILCGSIGLEREKRGRSAGLRTHLLVGFGSSVIMIVSIYGFPATSKLDVARLAAGVVSGVGFLGAGAIIHHEGGIKGLTTASTIWLVMAIGLACGSMNFILALCATVVVMLVLILFRRIESIVTRNNPTVVLTVNENVAVMTILLKLAREYGYTVSDITSQMIKNGDTNSVEVKFKIASSKVSQGIQDEFVRVLERETNAINIELLHHN